MLKLQNRQRLFFLAILICSFLHVTQVVAAPLRVKLSLKENAAENRLAEPVTSGIPLPRGVIFPDKNTGQLPLKLVDKEGKTVPAQFNVTAPWPDGSVRWVLLDFQASIQSKKQQEYYLEQTDSPQTPPSSLKVQDENGKITVDTGAITFTVNKTNFNLLDQVIINSNRQEIISSGHKEGIVLVDDKDQRYLAALASPQEIRVEEVTPLRTIILVRGQYKAENGQTFYPQAANYTVRIYAYNNKDYIRLLFSLENNGRYGFRHEDHKSDSFLIESLHLSLPLKLEDSLNMSSNNADESFKASDRFFLFQRHTTLNLYNETKNFEYFMKHNDEQIEAGLFANGWLDLKGTNKGFTLAMRHFWQNYPKALELTNGKLFLHLWPKGGKWPPDAEKFYKIRGGTHKTYEVLLRFYNPKSDKLSGKQLVAAFSSPMLALPSPEWFSETKAIGWIAPASKKRKEVELNEALQRYEKLQRCKVHVEDAEEQHGEVPPSTVYTERMARGEGLDWYGWMDFGDLAWGGETGEGAYASTHYDWPYGMLLHFIRTSDYAFFDLGDEIARHRMDIDQYHSKNGSPWLANFQWNEFGTHERSPEPWEPNPSHTWIKGLVLYHLLTGNLKSKEVALAVGEATKYYWTHDWGDTRPGSAELRIQGWCIENLIELYRLTGNKEYLDLATTVYRERTNPFITPEGYAGNPREVNIYQLVLVLEPLIELDLFIEDEYLQDDILRILEFLTKHAYMGGKTHEVKKQPFYQQYYLPYLMNVHTGLKTASAPGYNFMVSNALAYAYWITGDEPYKELSHKLFRDAVFYWQEDPVMINPYRRSEIAYAASHFPGSRTKIHGWINRYPQKYLYLLNHTKEDITPPAAIKDLELMVKYGKIILDWTAPGDDGIHGKASKYQIKYATHNVGSTMGWLQANHLAGEPVPGEYTTLQEYTVPALKTGKTYYFAIRSFDEANNIAAISNVVSIKLK